ncbi:MAG: hypothetical protein RL235_328, partial [Chlamydiota bacterium]
GLRPAHYREIFASFPPIDWFEIIGENFIDAPAQVDANLERIVAQYPVVIHCVSLSIGGPQPLDFDFLKKIKNLARKIKAPWISDHLCWGQVPGSHLHDLLPLPFTHETLAYAAERARIVQDYLELPFALENLSSYASFHADAMNEWDFYAGVVDKGGISMMLDVNNIYVSSRNQGFAPADYYRKLPLDKVIQIHLAGHADYGTYCLDTHDRHVCDAVWQIYADVYAETGPVSTLLEWDDRFISFDATWQEALRAKQFQLALQ